MQVSKSGNKKPQTRQLRQQVTNNVSQDGVVSDATFGAASDVSSAPVSVADAAVQSVNSTTSADKATSEFDIGERRVQGLFEPTFLCNFEKLVNLQRHDSIIASKQCLSMCLKPLN